MSYLAPLAAAAAPAIGGLVGGLMGGAGSSNPTVAYAPPGFNAGGLKATFGSNGYKIKPSADRMSAVNSLSSTFGSQANALGGLLSRIAPGYSALRAAQLDALNSNRASTLSTLRQNLAQRRVLGSSFGQNQISNENAQFNQDQANIIANTYLQEISASNQLINEQYTAARGQFQSVLDEMNFEAGIAKDLTLKASSTLESAASTQAQLDAKAAAGAGSFFGGIGTQLGQGVGKFLGGMSGTAASGSAGTALGLAMAGL